MKHSLFIVPAFTASNVVAIAVQQSRDRDGNSWFGEQHEIDIELQGNQPALRKGEVQ